MPIRLHYGLHSRVWQKAGLGRPVFYLFRRNCNWVLPKVRIFSQSECPVYRLVYWLTMFLSNVSGYACARDVKGSNTCSVVITTPTTIPSASCAGTDITKQGMKVFPDVIATTTSQPDGGVVTTTTTRTVTLFAHMFQLNYQSSDLVSATASTSSTGTNPTTTNTADASQNNGLSTGAKAGIGVGVGLGCILILGLLAIFFRRMRKSGKESGQRSLEGAEDGTKVGRFGAGPGSVGPTSEKFTTQELHGSAAPTELPSQPPVELPATASTQR